MAVGPLLDIGCADRVEVLRDVLEVPLELVAVHRVAVEILVIPAVVAVKDPVVVEDNQVVPMMSPTPSVDTGRLESSENEMFDY